MMNSFINAIGRFEDWPTLPQCSWRTRRVPYFQQLQATDCGATCLAMVLAYHGKWVRPDEIRTVTGVDRDGANALALLQAACWYGLRGRGVKLDIADLDYLEPGAILHWEFNHFVVFERLDKAGVALVDPAIGRRVVALDEFRRSFTGVALVLEPGEAFQPTKAAPRWPGSALSRYLKPILAQTSLLTRIGVTSLLLQLFALALPMLTGALIDRVVPHQDYHLLGVLGAGLLMLLLFSTLASLIRTQLFLHLRTHLDLRLTLNFVEHLVDLPYTFFERRSTGDLMMRINSNATVREMLTSSALSGALDGSLVSLYLVLLLLTNALLGGLVLLLGLLQVGVYLLSQRRYREWMAKDLQTQAKTKGYLVQMMAGMETLKASGAEHRAVEHWSNLLVDELNVALQRSQLSALVDTLMSVLRMGSPLLILLVGGYQVLNGQLTLGSMLAFNALAGAFLGPLSTLVSTALQLQLVRSYMERLDDVFDTPPEQAKTQVACAHSLRGAITLEQVNFRYGPLAPLVVQNLALDIQPGQFVAIVGPSGAGKSTLANLLLGLYSPTSGRILYDGHDLAGLDLRSVRSQLGIVSQHPYLFGATVRENIALTDPTLPLAAIVEAAERADIHADIVALPMGYETMLADGGASLSGGQRQRIALARALVHKPAILLLDEATSALDTITESKVQQALAALPCTRIVIAQRLSTIRHADLILVMAHGQLVEQGTHELLIAHGGVYAALVAAQREQK
ncbi:MAG: peptidase domain-containing ABC transporter [Caldilineaceae bacterium]